MHFGRNHNQIRLTVEAKASHLVNRYSDRLLEVEPRLSR